jgi:hypothetical protein
MTALSSAQQSEVKAWEEEILACEHTLTLHQEPLINAGDRECFTCFTRLKGETDARSPYPVYRVRPQFKPVVVFDVWFCELWEAAVWWSGRQRARSAALAGDGPSRRCQARHDHPGGHRRWVPDQDSLSVSLTSQISTATRATMPRLTPSWQTTSTLSVSR